ncbi:hypothetical protein L486_04747 [Kwoniella mangroviensis CBS 10435]|uniref:Calpain catalytic domain-containing protein n=1 Tax=Kwoniella mangroviensis CBS 10435 TaxID=1331196 RepID=A0A1B9IPA0_9TREE|nr:hypothetical protein L486_04747 [Kwoniella mangroviensis CBS 10435]
MTSTSTMCLQSILTTLLLAVLVTTDELVTAVPTSLQIRGETTKAPLISSKGIKPEDVDQGSWDSSWFNSVAVAIGHARPNDLEQCWSGSSTDEITEADFNLYDKQGEKKTLKVKLKDVMDKNEADSHSVKQGWWIGGLEHAALQMGGYTGLDTDHFTTGQPTDAFKMLANKDAEVYDFAKEQNKDDLLIEVYLRCVRTLFTWAAHTPIVFSSIATDGTEVWFAALSATSGDLEDGEKPWEKGEVKYYAANRHTIDTLNLAKEGDQIAHAVHWKFD